jgi:hypothetical protein
MTDSRRRDALNNARRRDIDAFAGGFVSGQRDPRQSEQSADKGEAGLIQHEDLLLFGVAIFERVVS